jgi:hypothetical protein
MTPLRANIVEPPSSTPHAADFPYGFVINLGTAMLGFLLLGAAEEATE